MNIILYNHAKNIKSESNFEMQSLQIKENQNNEIPFAENCWLVLNIWWTVYNTYYQLTMHVREIYNINDPQNIVATVPEFTQSRSELFFLIIFALIWGESTIEED